MQWDLLQIPDNPHRNMPVFLLSCRIIFPGEFFPLLEWTNPVGIMVNRKQLLKGSEVCSYS